MNRNKKILAGAGAILLVLGLVAAVQAADEMEEGRLGRALMFGRGKGAGMQGLATLEELGLPQDATREQIRDAKWSKKLSDLGLSEQSTIGQLRAAMEEKHEEKFEQMRLELGLDPDASEEEVRQAMKEAFGGRGGKRGPGGRQGLGGGCPHTQEATQ